MNNYSDKKDLKFILVCFLIEVIMLVVCFVIAHNSVNDNSVANFKQTASSMSKVNDNIFLNSFNGEGTDAFVLLQDDNLSSFEHVKSNYKYYTFSLSDDGIDTDMIKGVSGLEIEGLMANTATNTIIP